MKKIFIIITFFVASTIFNTTAKGQCYLHGDCDQPAERDAFIPDVNSNPITILLKFNIFLMGNGTSGSKEPITEERVIAQVNRLNDDFRDARIQFAYEMEYILSDEYFNCYYADEDKLNALLDFADEPEKKINIFVVILNHCGGSYSLPWYIEGESPEDFKNACIRYSYNCFGDSRLTHELGHVFGLFHTYEGTTNPYNNPLDCSDPCYENAGAPPEERDLVGDYCSDTPPTPRIAGGCVHNPDGVDPCNDVPWGTVLPNNFMSHSLADCLDSFTSQQMGRMRCWIYDKLSNWIIDNELDVDHPVKFPLDEEVPLVIAVRDRATGYPVPNAYVFVTGCGISVADQTNEIGIFDYEENVTARSTGYVMIMVTATDYALYQSHIKACEGNVDIVIKDCDGDDGKMPSWDADRNGAWSGLGIMDDRDAYCSPDIYNTGVLVPGESELELHLQARIWNKGTESGSTCDVYFYGIVPDIFVPKAEHLMPLNDEPIQIIVEEPGVPSYASIRVNPGWTWWYRFPHYYAGGVVYAYPRFKIYVEAECSQDPCLDPPYEYTTTYDRATWDNNKAIKSGYRIVLGAIPDPVEPVLGFDFSDTISYRIENPFDNEIIDILLSIYPENWSSTMTFELSSATGPDPDITQIDSITYLLQNMNPDEEKLVTLTFDSPVCNDTTTVHLIGTIDDNPVGSATIHILPSECPIIKIEKTHGTLQGHYENVSITTEGGIYKTGGFDFLIAYDASALTAVEVIPGQLLVDCDWEYFTYRFGVQGNCGNACPSGLLRIVAISETNDGPNHPACYGPPDCDQYELANMKFLVTNDRTYSGQFVPIRFFWDDCGDNSYSSLDGGLLYIDRAIMEFDGTMIWDEEDDDQFPEDARIPFVGAPDYCLNTDPDKPGAQRCPIFVNGGIDIIHSDSIDTRGDINLNGAAYEIADAVVFTNYFIYGLEAFTINQEGQIAATDVNADGMVLSVADLTYLIRVIIGDALPYPKIAPVTAKYDIQDGVLSVNREMGAAYVVIKGNANPVNLTDNMDLKYAYDSENDVTRALLYSMDKGHIFKGEFLEPGGTLIEIEMATYEGTTVKLITDLLPTEFVLHQNKPNPFNPITDMSFSLPVASDVILEIYNITGQKVATVVEDRFEAGTHTVRWDGSNYASGIYMYRITAGEFTNSKKMLLLK